MTKFGKDTFDVLIMILKVICKIKVMEKVIECESVQNDQSESGQSDQK
jgi:hypothetical protein